MTEQSTLLTLQTSVTGQLWTLMDADAKISTFAHLCEWRFSI